MQDQFLETALGQQPRRPPSERDRLSATERRQPSQDYRKNQNKQDPDQERRQRNADERDRKKKLGHHRIAPQRGVHARGYAQHQRQERRGDRKLEGRRDALLEQRRNGPALAQRQAEFAVDGALDKASELDIEGPVETEVGAKLRAVFLRGVLTDHESYRIAREIEQTESDERHHRHDGEGLQDAAENESEHGNRWCLKPQ